MNRKAQIGLLLFLALVAASTIVQAVKHPPKASSEPASTESPAPVDSFDAPPPPAPYVLPDSISVDFRVERGPKGDIYLVGTTNLPEGTKLGAEVPVGGGQDFAIFVHHGAFRSGGFGSKTGPIAAGKHKVELLAHFTSFWQSAPILQVVGDGGVNLKGPLVKAAGKNSLGDIKIIDETRALDFPPVQANTVTEDLAPAAIDLVQDTVVVVNGRHAAADTRTGVAGFMQQNPTMRPDGWSGQSAGPTTFTVDYSVIDGARGRQHATWTADVAAKTVECTNPLACTMSLAGRSN